MCALLLENAETHLGQPKVQQHFLIHLQQMNLEDEFVIASVQSAHCHLREGGEVFFSILQPQAATPQLS